jgi:hypothetical protein
VKRGAATVAAALLVTLLAGCSSPTLPPKSASVVSVTRTYLAAARGGDCDVTKALTLSSTFAWCTNPTLRSYDVTGDFFVSPAQAGVPRETCVDTTVTSEASGTNLMLDGTHPWSFCFVTTGNGWRLRDQGQG